MRRAALPIKREAVGGPLHLTAGLCENKTSSPRLFGGDDE